MYVIYTFWFLTFFLLTNYHRYFVSMVQENCNICAFLKKKHINISNGINMQKKYIYIYEPALISIKSKTHNEKIPIVSLQHAKYHVWLASSPFVFSRAGYDITVWLLTTVLWIDCDDFISTSSNHQNSV